MLNSIVRMLQVQVSFMPISVHPVVLLDADGATLIDSAYPGQYPAFVRALEEVGLRPCDLRRVILTHQDLDHLGIMHELIADCGGQLDIYAHPLDRPHIEGSRPYLKITPERIATRLGNTPPERRAAVSALYDMVPNFPVTHLLQDGDVLPFHGGIRVIHTPGHTPGHLCLYLAGERTLIPGDAVRVENGALVGPSSEHTLDMSEALRSLRKLVGLDITEVYSFHGGYCSGAIPAKIRALAGA
jgi:glyoxylase-like metal-dependent hydrolase (beta-lactamase superfamily II)